MYMYMYIYICIYIYIYMCFFFFLGVLYQSILNAKLTRRKKLGKKRCTSNSDDRKLENTVKQSRFKHLGELHKEWTEAGVSASRVI